MLPFVLTTAASAPLSHRPGFKLVAYMTAAAAAAAAAATERWCSVVLVILQQQQQQQLPLSVYYDRL
jgi:hypothetical protein